MTADEDTIDWTTFEEARARFGAGLARVLLYLREDGETAIEAITAAIRAGDAAALVKPASVLKDGSYEVGAEALGEAAERIEAIARHCVNVHETPDEALPIAADLPRLFARTVELLEEASSPLQTKAVRRTG